MKKHVHAFPVLLTVILYVLLFISCSAIRILSTEADPGFRLSDYETFAFAEMTIDTSIDPVYVKRIDWIKQDIAEYLTDRELRPSAGNSGLLINIGIVVEEKYIHVQHPSMKPPFTWSSATSSGRVRKLKQAVIMRVQLQSI
jgi:hypothetical protein